MRDIYCQVCPDFWLLYNKLDTERCAESVEALFIVVISLITGGCEMAGGGEICRRDDKGCYCWAAGQYGTLVEIPLESVYRHARGQTPGSWPLLPVNPSPVAYCTGPQTRRVTVSQPGLRPSWNHQLWDLAHLIDHFYRSPKACLAITEYSVFYSYVQIQISLCIWYVEQISNSS